jgi:hypothetical protein
MIFNILTLMLALMASAIASPTDITAREDLPPADTSNESCAKCINDKGNIEYLWASGKCNTLPDGHTYYACGKLYRCGICMLFKGEQCKQLHLRRLWDFG